jgi:hypothetical protein
MDPRLRPGTKHCLCSACGEYFTTPANFDAHRQGNAQNRRCVNPATMTRKNGKPRFTLNARGLWASYGQAPKHN